MNAPLSLQQQEDAYLARLGERVRAWRTEHGMSRKSLALASGVSERYLAQLEAGQGNISVARLIGTAFPYATLIENFTGSLAITSSSRTRNGRRQMTSVSTHQPPRSSSSL